MTCSRDVKTTRPSATMPSLRIASRMTANACWPRNYFTCSLSRERESDDVAKLAGWVAMKSPESINATRLDLRVRAD
jgi:hypothetical protein